MQTPTQRMLKLTLEAISLKQAKGLALSAADENLLAECQRIYHSKPKEKMTVDHTGTVHIVKSNDVSPIISAIHEYRGLLSKHKNGAVGSRLIGSVDPITAENWMKATGLKAGTKEFALYAKRMLNSGEYSKFKVDYK